MLGSGSTTPEGVVEKDAESEKHSVIL